MESLSLNIVLSQAMEKNMPEGIKKSDYGTVYITPRDPKALNRHDLIYFHGTGARITGDQETVTSWLSSHPKFWLYEGHPMMEDFKLHTIENGSLIETTLF